MKNRLFCGILSISLLICLLAFSVSAEGPTGRWEEPTRPTVAEPTLPPELATTAPEQDTPEPAVPKETFPWGIVIGVVAAAAVTGAATLVILKKKQK